MPDTCDVIANEMKQSMHLEEIATGFALATTSSDRHGALRLAMT